MISVRLLGSVLLFGSVLLCGVFLVGCGSEGPEVAEVSGTVTLDGKPLPKATIMFTPVAKGRPSVAVSDEEGHCTLAFTEDRPGAMLGEHIVTVTTSGEYYDEEGNEVERKELVPPKYNADKAYKQTVKEGSNAIDLMLASDSAGSSAGSQDGASE